MMRVVGDLGYAVSKSSKIHIRLASTNLIFYLTSNGSYSKNLAILSSFLVVTRIIDLP